MKTDKEYPATHSMSTSWYVVDDEGNVGLMNYNEDGPIPWGTPKEISCESLIFGYIVDYKNGKLLFNLTDEQILDLLHNPHKPSEEQRWYDCVVRIDKDKKDRFLELCKNIERDYNRPLCLSEEKGLYKFNDDNCVLRGKHYEIISVKGYLKTMLDEDIILEVYELQSYYMNEKMEGEKIVHTKEFDNSPYYIFHQPYWTEALPQKMHEPEHPVNIEQIPKEFRNRLHRIPGNFKDMDTFQIAQYYPCNANANINPSYYVDGCLYQTSPLPDGSKIYTKITMYEYNFLPYCPEKCRYHCENECSNKCLRCESILLADNPTVLIVFDPKEEDKFIWKATSDLVMRRAYATPYIPRFPFQDQKGSFRYNVEKYMTRNTLSNLFAQSKGYLETIIDDMKPYVILAAGNAFTVLKDNYSADSDVITINGVDYPFYRMSSFKKKRTIIEELSQRPYRGKEHPLVITINEMENLVKKGVAIECE